MRATVLQKYNDPLLAIPHPDPISKPMVVREITNSCSFPAIEYDGSTIISQYDGSSYYAKRYNAANSVVWTLAAPTSLVSGADRITPITYMGGYYYGVAINGTTYAAILFRLTSPTTSGATTAVGSQFTLSPQIASSAAINLSLTLLANGNFRIRNHSGISIYDAIVNSSGAIISTGAVQQNGNNLILQTAGCYYETLDGTIQFGAIDTNGYATIAKNGIAMRVKISWASAQNGTIGLRLHDGYAHITGNTVTAGTTYHYGLGAVSIASLDAHLHAICDMMGM